MKKIIILVAFWISLSSLSYSQTIKSIVLNANDKSPLNYVSVYNRTTHKFIITDKNGRFELVASKKDSIELRVLGYEEKVLAANDLKDTITLNSKQVELKTILLTNKESKKINDKIKTNIQLGLDYLGTYAFKINIPDYSIVTSIELPIKHRPYYLKDGTINFQIYESESSKFRLKKPITEIISIDDIGEKDDKLILDFDDFEIIKSSSYYVLITRTIQNDKISDSRSFSLNPFLKFDKKGKSEDYFYKFNGTDDWKISTEFYEKDKPRLSVEIYGYKSSE